MQPAPPPIPAAVVAQRDAARRLVIARCRELVKPAVAITRRARTLTPRTALAELIHLAKREPLPRVVATKRKGAKIAPRWLAISAVAAEAERLLAKDPVLKTVESPVVGLLSATLRRWSSSPPEHVAGDIARLESGASLLERNYLDDAARSLKRLTEDEPHRMFALEAVCMATVSELRSRGWSESGLRTWFETFEREDVTPAFQRMLVLKKRSLRCFVPVSGWQAERDLAESHPMHIEASYGKRLVVEDFPGGPYLTQWIRAFDEAEAAERAFLSARGVLDAVALVEPQLAAKWRTSVVGVENGSRLEVHDVGRWRGSTDPLAAEVHALVEQDALGEACRYRVQATQLRDPFTRLSLLWLGLESLVTGSREYEDTKRALWALVPGAMAMHKVKSEIEALARELESSDWPEVDRGVLSRELGWEDEHLGRVDFLGWLQRATEEQALRVRTTIARTDVRLAQWLERVRMHMTGPSEERVQSFFDATRQRIAWQLMRMHRAHRREGVEHWPLAWVHDLSLHAHHYLTRSILDVMNDRESSGPAERPVDVVTRRAAEYEIYVGLVQEKDERALAPAALLEPRSLVGTIRPR